MLKLNESKIKIAILVNNLSLVFRKYISKLSSAGDSSFSSGAYLYKLGFGAPSILTYHSGGTTPSWCNVTVPYRTRAQL